jgi:hypothetical protein
MADDFATTAADVRELARLVSTGDWRDDRRAAAGLLLHVNAELSARAAKILGHGEAAISFDVLTQTFEDESAEAEDFVISLFELDVATGGIVKQVRRPFLNSLLMTMLNELLKRLPGLLDEFLGSR